MRGRRFSWMVVMAVCISGPGAEIGRAAVDGRITVKERRDSFLILSDHFEVTSYKDIDPGTLLHSEKRILAQLSAGARPVTAWDIPVDLRKYVAQAEPRDQRGLFFAAAVTNMLETAYQEYQDAQFQPPTSRIWVVIRRGTPDNDTASWSTDVETINVWVVPAKEEALMNLARWRHDTAHELFHALQQHRCGRYTMDRLRWIAEPMADYAAHHIAWARGGQGTVLGGDLKGTRDERAWTTSGTGLMGDSIHRRYIHKPLTYIGTPGEGDVYIEHELQTAWFLEYLFANHAGNPQALLDATAKKRSGMDLIRRKTTGRIPENFFWSFLAGQVGDRTRAGQLYRRYAAYLELSSESPAVLAAGDPMPVAEGDVNVLKRKQGKIHVSLRLNGPGTGVLQAFRVDSAFWDREELGRRKQIRLELGKALPEGVHVDVFRSRGLRPLPGQPRPDVEFTAEGKSAGALDVRPDDVVFVLATDCRVGRKNVSPTTVKLIVSFAQPTFLIRAEPDGRIPTTFHFAVEAVDPPEGVELVYEWNPSDGGRRSTLEDHCTHGYTDWGSQRMAVDVLEKKSGIVLGSASVGVEVAKVVGTLTVTVSDAATEAPVGGSTVTLKGSQLLDSRVSGGSGQVTFADLPTDVYEVSVTADRYEPGGGRLDFDPSNSPQVRRAFSLHAIESDQPTKDTLPPVTTGQSKADRRAAIIAWRDAEIERVRAEGNAILDAIRPKLDAVAQNPPDDMVCERDEAGCGFTGRHWYTGDASFTCPNCHRTSVQLADYVPDGFSMSMNQVRTIYRKRMDDVRQKAAAMLDALD